MKLGKLVPAALLLLSSSTAQSEATGNRLLRACSETIKYLEAREYNDLDFGYCVGYLTGLQGMEWFTRVVLEQQDKLFCIPAGVGAEQRVRVVVQYLEEHPERLHLPAAGEVAIALNKAFPCADNQQ